MNQSKAPIYEALEKFRKMRIVPFDVPGHKRGRGNPELVELLGEKCVGIDVNSMKPLDNLCHPVSVIKEAEELAADAFGAYYAFLMVGGTTSAVQTMILSCCKQGDKIILPRNVHRSAINALVLCGAIPVYVNPKIDHELGISLGMEMEDVKRAIEKNPDAKAILVNNPTYYGICSALEDIVKLGHEHGMKVLVDEAHGTHFYFGKNMPITAMKAKADMASVSMHKSGGSLTQSSFLLIGENMNKGYVRQIINLTQTTSASYLLLSSLDISRRNLALRGQEAFERVEYLASYARNEINRIGGYYAFGPELINKNSIYDFYISVGDRKQDIERLVTALADIKRRYSKDRAGLMSNEYINPKVIMSPQDSFYAQKESLPIQETVGKVCSEFVMCYPPGIPILAPGELITQEIIDYITYAKDKGCSITGPVDPYINELNVIKGREE